MRRRDFISLLGGAAAFAPMAASAQQPGRIYRVAVLLPVRRPSPSMDAFIDEMRQAGFVQGRNLELNAPDGFNLSDEQIAELTERLVKTRPDAIVAGTAAGVRAAQQATQTIPIVAMSEDMLTKITSRKNTEANGAISRCPRKILALRGNFTPGFRLRC